MDYGGLIRDAWAATWRYRYLWLLGFFAGGAVGASSGNQAQWRVNQNDAQDLPTALVELGDRTVAWLTANWVPLVLVTVIVGLAALVLSFIAQGGMAQATADIAEGRGSSFGQAWRAGLHYWWRYAGLWLILLVLAFLAAALIGVSIALGLGLFAVDPVRGALIVALILLLVPLGLAALAAAVAGSIVVAYAQRAVVIADEGPVAALGDGWRLFRGHIGVSVLAWLVNVALSIGAGIAAAVVLALVFGLLGLVGLALWAALGTGATIIAYAAVAGLAFFAVVITAAGIANTFFWHYWTLAYLRLSGTPHAA